jgi:hypothetical protein
MTRVNERELRLSQDLISLQRAYNACVRHRDELSKELETLKKLYDVKMRESDKRAAKLQAALNRAKKLEKLAVIKPK